MGLVVAPILEGKLDAWKNWVAEFKVARKGEFDEFNERYGLTRHDIWLVESPSGPMAVVLHEGPGADAFMEKVMHSENGFDNTFTKNLSEFHGMDPNSPPPGPPPVKVL